jgi:predicted Zn-dependent peptidase
LKISGEIEDVNGVERSALLDFYRRYFGTQGCILSVAGGFDSDTVVSLLESRLADAPGGQTVPERVVPLRRSSWRHVRGPFKQVQIFTGVNFPLPSSTEAFFRLLVFSTVFGESMSSRLFQELRENKGLCYAVYSFRAYYADSAVWSIYAGTSPQLVVSLVEALNLELRRFMQEAPSQEEIADAKSHLRGGVALSKDDVEARMRRLARQEMLNGVVLDYDEAVQVLDGVTREHVVKLIDDLVRADEFNLLAYGGKAIGRLEQTRFSF